ncbi:MAG: L,D-transpeptidase [Myxococcota bacterium]
MTVAWLLAMSLGCDPWGATGATRPTGQTPVDEAVPSPPAPPDPLSPTRSPVPSSVPPRTTTAPIVPGSPPSSPSSPTSSLTSPPTSPPIITAGTRPTTAAPPTADLALAPEHRRAGRALMVYTEPHYGTEFRGKIPRGQVFELLERIERIERTERTECKGDGWGRLDTAAYVCLHRTEPVDDPAPLLPERLADGLAPFFYARLQKRGSHTEPTPAPRWRSRRAMRRGVPPEDHLQPEHDYAFVRRRRSRDGALLVTASNRVVREADVHRMKPSPFAGRNVRARPIPPNTVIAWSIDWPYATIRAQPDPEAEEVGRLPLHAEALLRGESPDPPPDEPQTEPPGPPRIEPTTHRGARWRPVLEPAEGWIPVSQIRWWAPMPPPTDVDPHEIWLDVDLDQQVLALRRGSTLEFVTLISSGSPKHATPTGLFRLLSKWAFADMRSRPNDPEDPYYVEGVPWVQYFRGRYALHGTFWHNRFGRRTSHGCINLSAHDARWIYEHTAPAARPGWLVIHEHTQDPGTLLRIRKGTAEPPDRRRPPRGH